MSVNSKVCRGSSTLYTLSLAFTHFAWIGPNKLGEINHDSLVQNIWFLYQSVLLPYTSEDLKIFHFPQEFDSTRVIFSGNNLTTCTMGGYRAIIIQILEGNFKIQMIFGGICHSEIQSLLEFCKESGESSEFWSNFETLRSEWKQN